MTRDASIARGLFVLTLVAYGWFFNGAGWNANAQLDLARALVERRTFAIEAYSANTGDVSTAGGHVYSNKPPGASLLAAVPYAVLHAFERAAGIDVNAPRVLIVNLWLLTFLTCGVTGALIPVAIYRWGRRLQIDPATAAAVALAMAFGTYLFAYSTKFFNHVPTALFLLLAFVWLESKPWLAGAAAGMAGICFYLAIPAAAILALLAWSRSWRGAARFVAGGLPFAVGLLLYHYALFGSPWVNTVETSERFTQEGLIFGLFAEPRLSTLWEITFGRRRGLFYLSPFLLLAIAGVVRMVRERILRRELAAVVAVTTFFVAANMSYTIWHGGSGIGPRFLLAVVPLLSLPLFFAWNVLRPVRTALLIWSVAVNLLVAAVNPSPSQTIADPVGSYVVPLFFTGRLPASTPPEPLFGWKIMLGHVSVNTHVPDELHPFTRHAPGSPEARWASFNLGELVAENSPWSVLPVAVWIAGGSLWLVRRARHGAP
jgi:hypothetical protein